MFRGIILIINRQNTIYLHYFITYQEQDTQIWLKINLDDIHNKIFTNNYKTFPVIIIIDIYLKITFS